MPSRLAGRGARPRGTLQLSLMRSTRDSEPGGFTLLEVLIVLALLGLMLTGLVQASRVVLLTWEMHGRLLQRNSDLDAAVRTLRRLIEQAAPGSKWEPLVFVGTAHSVKFTSAMPVAIGEVPTRRADVELSVDAAHRLMLVWTPHLHAIRIGRPPRAVMTEVLQGVDRLELSYFPATQNGGWTPVWRDPIAPRLVRIQIIFAGQGHSQSPDVIAATRLGPP